MGFRDRGGNTRSFPVRGEPDEPTLWDHNPRCGQPGRGSANSARDPPTREGEPAAWAKAALERARGLVPMAVSCQAAATFWCCQAVFSSYLVPVLRQPCRMPTSRFASCRSAAWWPIFLARSAS